jgi:putative alpha-1,2-mannosidase
MDAFKNNLDLEYGFLRRRVAMVKMNMVLKTNFLPAAFFLIVIASHTHAQRRPVDYVNPLIGTAPITDKRYLGNNPAPGEELYSGTVNPCAMVPDPEGYLCVGPVTGFDGAYHVRGSGYRFDDATIMGFTQMNGEYSDQNRLLFMPTTGTIKTSPGSRTDPFVGYRSARDPQSERASPGYYSVFLTTYGIKVELTSTAHCGFHRYTFPVSRQANILIDLANSRPAVSNASVSVVDKHTIEGFQTGGTSTVFFRAEFNKDFSSSGTWKNSILTKESSTVSGSPIGAYVTFNTSPRETILVKVGTSTISLADAAANLQKEIPSGTGFEAIKQQSRTLWSQILDRIVVAGGSEGDRTNFYTAVYRMAAGPKYAWFPFYDANGMLLARGGDWVSQRVASKERFWGWHWGGGYWGPGNVSGLVGLYKMGFHNFDVKAAYKELRNEALNGGGAAGAAYREYGYIPANSGVNDYVNRSIGLSLDDRSLSELAKLIGEDSDSEFFLKRSNSYRALYNSSLGFFAPRQKDGSWIVPLDPVEPHAEDIYREGNAWNYLWFNTADMPGLIDLLGGPHNFAARLDTFFTSTYNPRMPLRDLTGVIGLYFHGNEQYRHIPYLYDYVGQPWKTQALVRRIQRELYRPLPAGLCGMDDFGDLEGWYVTSALGYIQVDLASEYFQIGSPLFPIATIKLEGEHPGTFTIRANHVSDLNKYIQSAKLNGRPLNVPRFRQVDMVPGGSLVFEMGPTPNFNWGAEKP